MQGCDYYRKIVKAVNNVFGTTYKTEHEINWRYLISCAGFDIVSDFCEEFLMDSDSTEIWWDSLSRCGYITGEFLIRFKDKLNWLHISLWIRPDVLTNECCKSLQGYLQWDLILKRTKYYNWEFIESHLTSIPTHVIITYSPIRLPDEFIMKVLPTLDKEDVRIILNLERYSKELKKEIIKNYENL